MIQIPLIKCWLYWILWILILSCGKFYRISFLLLLFFPQNGTPPFSIITYLMAWFVREGLAIIIYLEAVAHPCTIKWGKRTYQVKIGGHASMVDEKRLLETWLDIIKTLRRHCLTTWNDIKFFHDQCANRAVRSCRFSYCDSKWEKVWLAVVRGPGVLLHEV